jgi:hypothetical protein
MKPHLLMLLLLAIPPLICNILACENAEKTDTPPAAKSESASKEIPAPATPPAATPPAAPAAAPAAQPVPSHGLPACTRAFFM